jgi:hypothetical protein
VERIYGDSKLLSSIIKADQKSINLAEQSGSMPSKRYVDAGATLTIALQSLKDSNQESCVLFVALLKAFDSVNREMMWKILARYEVPEPLANASVKMYASIEISTSVL